jgi:polysaccharide export outer membrane protein
VTRTILLTLIFLSASVACFAQVSRPVEDFTSTKPSTAPTGSTDYKIGSNDFLVVSVFGEPELASAGRVSATGVISLNLLGSVPAAGMTPRELEQKIETALKDRKFLNDPHVTVTIQEYASQPVQILGAVKMPNLYQLKGDKNLISVIAMAGGLSDNVGRNIQVLRGGNGKALGDLSGQETVTVSVEDFENSRIGLDVPIYANDAIYVSIAESVFVAGEVVRPDEVILRNGKDISVLTAYSQSGGFTRDAKRKDAVIIRIAKDGTLQDIPVNMEKMLKNEAPDVKMIPNDILYVPSNKAKAAINRALEGAISVVTGRLIY